MGLGIFQAGESPPFLQKDDLSFVEEVHAEVAAILGTKLARTPQSKGTACKRIGQVSISVEKIDDAGSYVVTGSKEEAEKPAGGPKPDQESGSWVIQSLIFDKDKFTAEEASKWIADHEGFGNHGVDETGQSYRYRQYDPAAFSTMRTKPLTDGVTAVMGRVKSADEEKVDGAALLAAEIEAIEAVRVLNKGIVRRGLRVVGRSSVAKAEAAEERFVLGIVLEPTDGGDGSVLKPDTQGDIYSADEIRKACHAWMERYGLVDLQHSWRALGKEDVRVLENYVAPAAFDIGEGDDAYHVQKGTWLLACRVANDEIWEGVKAGKIGAYSIGGEATRVPVEPAPEATP